MDVYKDNPGKADTHVHTKYSGFTMYSIAQYPESISEPEMVVEAAIGKGLDVVCITDHNTIDGALKAQKYARGDGKIDVVVGEEISTMDGELLGLYIHERIEPYLSAEETSRRIHEQGGIAIAPHPFSPHCECLGYKVQHLDLDGIEAFNAIHRDPYSNRLALEVLEDRAGTGGSDAHSIGMVGNAYTNFEGDTAEEFRTSLLNKNTFFGGKATSLSACVGWSIDVAAEIRRVSYRSLQGKIDNEDVLHTRIHRIKRRNKVLGILAASLFLAPGIPVISGAIGEVIIRKRSKRMWDENNNRNMNYNNP